MKASEDITTLFLSGGSEQVRVQGDAGDVASRLWPPANARPFHQSFTSATKLEMANGGTVFVNPDLVLYLR